MIFSECDSSRFLWLHKTRSYISRCICICCRRDLHWVAVGLLCWPSSSSSWYPQQHWARHVPHAGLECIESPQQCGLQQCPLEVSTNWLTACMSLLDTSLKQSFGFLHDLSPCSSSPYRRPWRMQPSAILWMCPSQWRCLWWRKVCMERMLALSSTVLSEIQSEQEMGENAAQAAHFLYNYYYLLPNDSIDTKLRN